jgi:dihydroneopterin aldolase
MKIELHGLDVFGYHGAEADEQRLGQPFLYDVELEVGDRGASDRLGDTIDYTQVAEAIRELSAARRFNLLETLATAMADMLMERFEPESLRLRIRKPQVQPAGLTVEYSAVSIERP